MELTSSAAGETAGRTREAGKRRGRSSNTSSRASQRYGRSRAPSSRSRDTRSSREGRRNAWASRLSEACAGVRRGRRLDREGDNVCASDDCQTQGTLLFLLDGLGS